MGKRREFKKAIAHPEITEDRCYIFAELIQDVKQQLVHIPDVSTQSTENRLAQVRRIERAEASAVQALEDNMSELHNET